MASWAPDHYFEEAGDMIHTDGRPTICSRGALEAALAEADRRDALKAQEVEAAAHAARMGGACCGDPGDCIGCPARGVS